MRIYIKNQQRLIKVDQHRIKRDLRKALHLLSLHKAEISVLFVNDRRMKLLNHQYRGIDRTTDVLSFSQIEDRTLNFELRTQNILLGDIVINLHQAKRQAVEHNLTFNEELRLLLMHGLLHLVGHDHEKGGYAKRKMEKKAREILERLRED